MTVAHNSVSSPCSSFFHHPLLTETQFCSRICCSLHVHVLWGRSAAQLPAHEGSILARWWFERERVTQCWPVGQEVEVGGLRERFSSLRRVTWEVSPTWGWAAATLQAWRELAQAPATTCGGERRKARAIWPVWLLSHPPVGFLVTWRYWSLVGLGFSCLPQRHLADSSPFKSRFRFLTSPSSRTPSVMGLPCHVVIIIYFSFSQ